MVLNLLVKQASSLKPPLIDFLCFPFVVMILRRLDMITWYEKLLLKKNLWWTGAQWFILAHTPWF